MLAADDREQAEGRLIADFIKCYAASLRFADEAQGDL